MISFSGGATITDGSAKKYLERVKEDEQLDMKMYVRYVDDSNQIISTSEQDVKKAVERLMAIANDILAGIIMEADYPAKNEDSKLPILDMQCWINESGHAVLYTHITRNPWHQNRSFLQGQPIQTNANGLYMSVRW